MSDKIRAYVVLVENPFDDLSLLPKITIVSAENRKMAMTDFDTSNSELFSKVGEIFGIPIFQIVPEKIPVFAVQHPYTKNCHCSSCRLSE